jgi:hypothetical protein
MILSPFRAVQSVRTPEASKVNDDLGENPYLVAQYLSIQRASRRASTCSSQNFPLRSGRSRRRGTAWIGEEERTIESVQGIFTTMGGEITSKIVFICSDIWEPYLEDRRRRSTRARVNSRFMLSPDRKRCAQNRVNCDGWAGGSFSSGLAGRGSESATV